MFPVTNNVAEYEALLVGLRLAKKIWVEKVTNYADSQLMVQKISREYEVKDPHMKKYHELVG